jgi:hypothetical protein
MERASPLTPYQRLVAGLLHFKKEITEEVDECLAFAEVMARQQNSVTYDDPSGHFYVTAVGPLEAVIPVMYKQLEQLERIKQQRDHR